MLCTPGTKVVLRYTGDRAIVLRRIDDETLLVRLENAPDVEIPVSEDDLLLYRPEGAAKAVAAPALAPPLRRQIRAERPSTHRQGIAVAFEPMLGRDGSVSRYTAWLLNDTDEECLFELALDTAARSVFQLEGKLEKAMALECGVLLTDDLSDQPEIFLSCRRISTEGLEAAQERRMRIRPKTFINARQATPILGVETHCFTLFKSLAAALPETPSAVDLRTYARQHTRPSQPESSPMVQPISPYDVGELAAFSNEIDLHAEKLLPNYRDLDPTQILHLQMAHFRRFIDQAVRLGLPRVFVIHGVGEGKLRNAIAEELRRHPAVWKFKNEYHRKYGYGATEVIFY